jgi:hypothetical protein
MGSIFPAIADEALTPMDPDSYPQCHVCARGELTVFTSHGTVTRADGSRDDVYVACADCLRAGKVEQIDEWSTDPVITEYAKRCAGAANEAAARALETRLKDKLRRTPHLAPQAQRTDWPLCCGDITEYTGSPEKRAEWELLTRSAFGWRRGEVLQPAPSEEDEPDEEWPDWHPWLEGFIPRDNGDGLPSLGGFATFRCIACGRCFWTFQCT